MRTLTGLSGEYVTFDQNGQKCRFNRFEILAADLPNWRFWEIDIVIGTIGQTVKVKIFWYFEILMIRSIDVIILKSVKGGQFGGRPE